MNICLELPRRESRSETNFRHGGLIFSLFGCPCATATTLLAQLLYLIAFLPSGPSGRWISFVASSQCFGATASYLVCVVVAAGTAAR